ncbi:MAG: hypothetical protein HQK53_01435 [Oligoflexia bacterium]|nr:hypothetical protein [Oligoflexia bacterium]
MDSKKKELINTILIVIVVVIITTLVYFKFNPRPSFKTTMQQAGRMALAANMQTQVPAVVPAPAEQGVIAPGQNFPQNQNQGQFISGGQYVCSQCGHTGLPHFDQNGIPHCTECGGVMKINQMNVNEAVQVCANNNCPR